MRGEWAACSSWRMRSRSESGRASSMAVREVKRASRPSARTIEAGSKETVTWQSERRLEAESTLAFCFPHSTRDCSTS